VLAVGWGQSGLSRKRRRMLGEEPARPLFLLSKLKWIRPTNKVCGIPASTGDPVVVTNLVLAKEGPWSD
jgi:hypothetical protein